MRECEQKLAQMQAQNLAKRKQQKQQCTIIVKIQNIMLPHKKHIIVITKSSTPHRGYNFRTPGCTLTENKINNMHTKHSGE